MRYLSYTSVFECSPYDYTLEWYTSIQAKIHDFMTYAFCRFFAFVYNRVHIPMFCLSIVNITMYSWLTEKYSQYDKPCKTARLNCIQPKSFIKYEHMFTYSCIPHMHECSYMHMFKHEFYSWMNTWIVIHMFFIWTYVHMNTYSYNRCMNIWTCIHLKNPLREIRLHTIQLYDHHQQKPYRKF